MTLPTLAFLGIGLMGRPMATRLTQAGHPLRAWNRSAGKAEALRAVGAEPQADLHTAVSGAAIVLSMLEAGPAVGQVIDAALPALGPGTLWIDMSSTRQDEAQGFGKRLQAHGMRFIDAPVSGGVGGAQAGSRVLDVHGLRMLERDFVPGGPVKNQAKDMRNILATARQAQLTLPFAELAERRFESIEDELGQADHSAALIALERDNAGVRLGSLPDKLP